MGRRKKKADPSNWCPSVLDLRFEGEGWAYTSIVSPSDLQKLRNFMEQVSQLHAVDWLATVKRAASVKFEKGLFSKSEYEANLALKLLALKFFRDDARYTRVANIALPEHASDPVVDWHAHIRSFFSASHQMPGTRSFSLSYGIRPELREKFGDSMRLDLKLPVGLVPQEVRINVPEVGVIVATFDDRVDIEAVHARIPIDDELICHWLNAESVHSDEDKRALLEAAGAYDEPVFEQALNYRLASYLQGFIHLGDFIAWHAVPPDGISIVPEGWEWPSDKEIDNGDRHHQHDDAVAVPLG